MELTVRNNIYTSTNDYSYLRNSRNISKNTEKTVSKTEINNVSKDTVEIESSTSLLKEIKSKENTSIAMQNGINILNKAKDVLEKSSEQVEKIKELTLQANNDSLNEEEKQKLVEKIEERVDNINQITNSFKFNKIQLLDGNKEELTIDTNKEEDVNIKSILNKVTAESLGFNEESLTDTQNLINTVNNALKIIKTQQSEIETHQNTLNESIKPINSQITTPGIANLSADKAKQNILQKALMNITMQINASPSMALNLLAA